MGQKLIVGLQFGFVGATVIDVKYKQEHERHYRTVQVESTACCQSSTMKANVRGMIWNLREEIGHEMEKRNFTITLDPNLQDEQQVISKNYDLLLDDVFSGHVKTCYLIIERVKFKYVWSSHRQRYLYLRDSEEIDDYENENVSSCEENITDESLLFAKGNIIQTVVEKRRAEKSQRTNRLLSISQQAVTEKATRTMAPIQQKRNPNQNNKFCK